jgi:putative tryptophan/tyrosine transport system substrate-binding protein
VAAAETNDTCAAHRTVAAGERSQRVSGKAGPIRSALVPNPTPFSSVVSLAARHHLPAVYATLAFVGNGALISYGGDQIHQFRRAAGYVDRILKGEKPADLPVQAPTKFKLVINLKT